MNHEVEAYEGELKELRWHRAVQVMEKMAFTWHKIECGTCGVNTDLLQRNDGKTMCRQCWQDHFEETEEA